MSEPGRVGILISGRGSNMVALVRGDAGRADTCRAGGGDLQRTGCRRTGQGRGPWACRPRLWIRKPSGPARSTRRRWSRFCGDYQVELVCLAGYMRLLKPLFVRAFPDRILNIHPSLLPAFPGLDAQRQALEHGVKAAGCTVHFVDEECDHGPIVLQAAVPVLDGDTEDDLSARILEQEHRIYPEAVALIFRPGVRIEGRAVIPLP